MAEDTQNPAAPDTNNNQPTQQFAMQRIYLKDLSFEAPMGPEVFKKQWNPAVHQDLGTKTTKIADDLYEVTLTLTVTVKLGEDTAFLIEAQQAGLFAIVGLEGIQLAHILNTVCPQILFPYCREVVDSAAVKGGFPALMLPPINFEALFAQAMAKAKTEQAPTEAAIN